MSLAWEQNLRLMEECDKAVEHCGLCDEYGHSWTECGKQPISLRVQPVFRDKFWLIALWLCTGFAAGFAFRALVEAFSR